MIATEHFQMSVIRSQLEIPRFYRAETTDLVRFSRALGAELTLLEVRRAELIRLSKESPVRYAHLQVHKARKFGSLRWRSSNSNHVSFEAVLELYAGQSASVIQWYKTMNHERTLINSYDLTVRSCLKYVTVCLESQRDLDKQS
jgi:hypothetical protein